MANANLKQWLSDRKVLFVTNSMLRPGGTFLASLLTYAEEIPIHNIAVIPGTRQLVKMGGEVYELPRYGIDVFEELSRRCMQDIVWKQFDYAVYIDDDCFVTDFERLMKMLDDFMKSGQCCLAGPQDGGVFCHRNHSHLMINTFISFWNLKMLRQNTNKEAFRLRLQNLQEGDKPYENFLKQINEDTKNLMINSAQSNIQLMTEWRRQKFPLVDGRHLCPYAKIVMDDPSNPVEPHQVPYSYKSSVQNFEPYYLIEQAWVLETNSPIEYFRACDLYGPEDNDEETDNSGLTSAVYDKQMNLVAVHTWFSRAYSKFPTDELMMKHTLRINKIISKYAKL